MQMQDQERIGPPNLPYTFKGFGHKVFVPVLKSSKSLERNFADRKQDETIVNLRNKKINSGHFKIVKKGKRVDSLKLKLAPVLRNLSHRDVRDLYTSTAGVGSVCQFERGKLRFQSRCSFSLFFSVK